MGYAIYKMNFDTNKHVKLYDCIDDIHTADLLAQLAMSDKTIDELIFICAGWNRGIKNKPEEYKRALELAEEYKSE